MQATERPVAIQPHGVLLIIQIPELIVRQASANCASLLGHGPAKIIDAPLETAVGETAAGQIAQATEEAMTQPGIQMAPITVSGRQLETRLHVTAGLLVCEFELMLDTATDPMWFPREITHSVSAFQRAEGVVPLAQLAAVELQRLTGYDRVTVYRSDVDGQDELLAEASVRQFPARSDQDPSIGGPRQADDAFLSQIPRQIVDVDYVPVPLVPAIPALAAYRLDLSRAGLRDVSSAYLWSLQSRGIRAALTISLIHEGELWGTIVCHHHAPRYLSPQVRAVCELIGEVVSLQFGREEQADSRREHEVLAGRLSAVLTALRDSGDLVGGLREQAESLRLLCDADGFAIDIDGERITGGTVPGLAIEEAIISRLGHQPIFSTDRLIDSFPKLASRLELSGALAVALPEGVGTYLVWYREDWRGGRARPWSGAQTGTAMQLARELVDQVVSTMRDRLAHIALHDPLTGLPNRILVVETLSQILRRRPQGGPEYVGVVFVDLDNFKLVNDAFGHAGGDALLRGVAGRLTEMLRSGDVVARLGGDEFVIVLQGIADTTGLEGAAERVRSLFELPFRLLGAETRASASIGVTAVELGAGHEAEELIREADLAMYEAKRQGRGQWVRYDERLKAERQRRVQVEHQLDRALTDGELFLEYQPILDSDLKIVGLEALARWNSPVLGQVPPGEFIPVAEEAGLMDRLGNWVLDAALDTQAALRRRSAIDLVMSVNISAAQLADIGLPDRVQRLLHRYGLAGTGLCLEITEGTLIANTAAAIPILERLRMLGVTIALDDFGTGFSSLAYLRRLPVDVLKIDRAFVAQLGQPDDTDAEVVAAVVDLAQRLKIRTVAEGVETQEQLQILRATRCDLLQGHLFSRSVPVDALLGLEGFADRRSA